MTKTKLFFDMDDTVTASKQVIEPAMRNTLTALIDRGCTIVIVSGSDNTNMTRQMLDVPIIMMGQSGNHCVHPTEGELWREVITPEEQTIVDEHIARIKPLLTHVVPDEHDLYEHRGSQISYSIYGHHAPREDKQACDGNRKKRLAALAAEPFDSDLLDVKIGGTTCFDYTKKGRVKGFNVDRLITHLGWDKADCIYYGDSLFPGGNDETVVGVIDTVAVEDHHDTLQKLQTLL